MAGSRSDDERAAGVPEVAVEEVEIGRAPEAALGEVIVSTLQGEGIAARLSGGRILVSVRFQAKAREILDFLHAEFIRSSR